MSNSRFIKPKNLYLILEKKWFDMIESGEKKEEYREITPYWFKRLLDTPENGYALFQMTPRKLSALAKSRLAEGKLKHFDAAAFQLGYTRRKMRYSIKSISIGKGKEEWGAGREKEYFVITLGERIK